MLINHEIWSGACLRAIEELAVGVCRITSDQLARTHVRYRTRHERKSLSSLWFIRPNIFAVSLTNVYPRRRDSEPKKNRRLDLTVSRSGVLDLIFSPSSIPVVDIRPWNGAEAKWIAMAVLSDGGALTGFGASPQQRDRRPGTQTSRCPYPTARPPLPRAKVPPYSGDERQKEFSDLCRVRAKATPGPRSSLPSMKTTPPDSSAALTFSTASISTFPSHLSILTTICLLTPARPASSSWLKSSRARPALRAIMISVVESIKTNRLQTN